MFRRQRVTHNRYRICRLTEVESHLLRRVGVGRHHDDPGEAPTWMKRGVIYVEFTDGREALYPIINVRTALQLYGGVVSADKPGEGYETWVSALEEDIHGEWYWYAESLSDA